MLAEDSLRKGNLAESLAQLQDQVRKEPANAKSRVFLFQLLAVMGDWKRALTQLGVLGEMDASTLAMVQTYREAVRCEALRAEVFAGERSPMLFGEPEQWVALLMEALRLTARGHHAQAQELRSQALESAPATPGTIDEAAFEWIADADSRLGPILETIVNGRYYWIPFHRIRRIAVEAPSDLRDIVWTPARFEWANGGEGVGLIPSRYPGSERSEDVSIRMARRTEWIEGEAEAYTGMGQRTLATDTDEYPLMNVRSIRLEPGNGAAAAD